MISQDIKMERNGRLESEQLIEKLSSLYDHYVKDSTL